MVTRARPLEFAPADTFRGFVDLNPLDQLMLMHAATPWAAAFWSQHGDAFLAAWVVEHPGTRPPWWWRLAAPRDAFRILGHVAATGYQGTERRESSAAFLARHGLLTPTELELFERGDLPAEEIVMPALQPRNGVDPVVVGRVNHHG